ncbi:DNA-binding transcriptional response regulator, NtrC family, contains REC, AAA-type ATPase, and a Fis-type DNA-binding domains [Desulfuromusa kysingii]|uniref:DNA-binding transcriptional response regulator, NtrC family, contains REC, AAA-type ATPase, and a Fis-type DNA-binding domains n=1 Tax=Desulfuromusa kysingii TaxID=37625 RepID=A0A1H4AZT0_9BACT|nr:sigma-54 dependent transcriptional regulator [Desulfuromusa kysingii]SEA41346.1 DNA-binding transcriptional response regulator, NtrC family, contains REC, AAA-type ATPase, and a Fis-type DNA-binding domains [Desulfuromusa kysingii]
MKELYPEWPILMVDDESALLRSLTVSLKSSGGFNNLLQCQDSRQVMDLLAEQQVSLILLDLTMPHVSGQELLTRICENYPHIPVIILSGLNQVETAVECIKNGAYDYFVKTEDQTRLFSEIRQALERFDLESQYVRLKNKFLNTELSQPEIFAGIVTQNNKMQAIFQYIEALASSREPVLIIGESGVGKDLIAKAIHAVRAKDRPWVAVNVAGLDDNMFADTLFGHTPGAFTGAEKSRNGMVAQAEDGTLFLDEIGDLSWASQVKLLRLIQEREYYVLGSDVPKTTKARFVFATNQSLEKACEEKSFRMDLYFRLRAHQINIPPLRERAEDIPLLVAHFVAEACESLNKPVPEVSQELIARLQQYSFPGNIRELRSMVYDALIVHKQGSISLNEFKKSIAMGSQQTVPSADASGSETSSLSFSSNLPTLEDAGRLLVCEAMKRSGDNQTLAARYLGISRQALSKRLKKYNM